MKAVCLAVELPQPVGGHYPQLVQQPVLKCLIDQDGLPLALQTEQGLHPLAAQLLVAGLQGECIPCRLGGLFPAPRRLQPGQDLQRGLEIKPVKHFGLLRRPGTAGQGGEKIPAVEGQGIQLEGEPPVLPLGLPGVLEELEKALTVQGEGNLIVPLTAALPAED